jgi:hypothetical protein
VGEVTERNRRQVSAALQQRPGKFVEQPMKGKEKEMGPGRQPREHRELARLMTFRQHANLALQVRVVDVHATLWAAMPRSDTLHMHGVR